MAHIGKVTDSALHGLDCKLQRLASRRAIKCMTIRTCLRTGFPAAHANNQQLRPAVMPAAASKSGHGLTKPHAPVHQPAYADEQLLRMPLAQLMQEAAALRDSMYTCITFSPKVFIPLTRLCRDTCGYCTFALPPSPHRRAYMTIDEVLALADQAAAQGCTEALFTLGDKPELRWPQAAAELQALGYASTLQYVEDAARQVIQHTGLLPHINAGVMGEEWLRRLKRVSASQGLMLEGVSPALMLPGGAHADCPDKDPDVRLEVLEAAGRARVPFTTGILIGIGESREERLAALRQIHASHQRHGHIQEVIIQNFRAKQGTAMATWAEPPLSELLWSIAAARLILGPHASIQAPPNLTPEADDATPHRSDQAEAGREASWKGLLDAGINDWGGISPITRDHVNPEAAWPHLTQLAAATAEAGWPLVPRLPVYPQYMGLRGGPQQVEAAQGAGGVSFTKAQQQQQQQLAAEPWLDGEGGRGSVQAAVLRQADSSGLVRGSQWYAGLPYQPDAADTQSAQPATQTQVKTHHAQQPAQAAMAQHDRAAIQPELNTIHTQQPAQAAQPTHQQQAQQQQTGSQQGPHQRVKPGRGWHISMDTSGCVQGMPRPRQVSWRIQRLLDKLQQATQDSSCTTNPLSQEDVAVLLTVRGADHDAVLAAADALRRQVCGDTVTYVVNRNINYTNACTFKCTFCAFSKGKASEELRGPTYLVSDEEVARRTAEAWDRGATEVCMQGGIHPAFTGHTYLSLLRAAKQAAPDIHVHAFSPLEVYQGASSLGLPVSQYLAMLKDAGLGSLPGTAAEVLCDDVRSVLCPDKINTDTWLEVVHAAHQVGLRTTSTLMFGHLEHGPAAWARHLTALRTLQIETGGITEFVPLPFVHMEAPLYLQGRARQGPTLHECLLLHAVARLALHPHITNIQASWVKMGPHHAADLLAAGCNDMGGVLMNESITRAAGASHGQQLAASDMEVIIRSAGRVPQQRTTLYGPNASCLGVPHPVYVSYSTTSDATAGMRAAVRMCVQQ